jgi:hypothetical protein
VYFQVIQSVKLVRSLGTLQAYFRMAKNGGLADVVCISVSYGSEREKLPWYRDIQKDAHTHTHTRDESQVYLHEPWIFQSCLKGLYLGTMVKW